MQNKLVVFDWGGIIESHRKGEYNVDKAKIELIHKFNYKAKDIVEKWSCDEIYEMEISTDDLILTKWFEKIKKIYEIDVPQVEFLKAYQSCYNNVWYYRSVVDYIRELHLAQDCKLGILSNLCRIDVDRLQRQVNLANFDYMWLSCQVGMRKPNWGIYRLVERESGLVGDNILYFEDSEENLVIPRELGWNTCLIDGHEVGKIKEEVEKFLRV